MTPLKLAEGMFEEIMAVIEQYSESMPVATAIGVVELVKVQLIHDHMSDEEDDE
jgi:hypothetical protein